ncbi:tRNA(Met) cytidine acetate ligase [Oscillospiraceae bacterium LTW-04]|nr:nucleotidyltransferase family protein [Oscillospiraceae bacterium MB24-C1]
MTIVAIAAEYNPFHNGHAYHIAKTREAGATHIVAIMSGNFTQRGTPAIAEKRARVRSALAGGADLILELPLPYAMATAQRFALGVAGIAEGMGCVDVLSFGSESGYLSILKAAANAVDSAPVCERMTQLLSTGITFARARQQAVSELCGDEIAETLGSPNDALAVEYIRQLKLMGSRIVPFAVVRNGARHDDVVAKGEMASASFLRALMRSGGVAAISDFMPEGAHAALGAAVQESLAPFDEKKLQAMMLGVLRRMTAEEISRVPDLSEGLENRIYAAIRQACSVEEIYTLAKSKRYTAARIRRVVMSAFLGLESIYGEQKPPYIRVLGFNTRGREILSRMKETATLPVSDSLAYLSRVNEVCAAFVELEARATDIYLLGLPVIRPCGYDYVADSVRDI